MLLSSHQHGVVKKEQPYDVCNFYERRRGWKNGALQYGYGCVPLRFRGNVITRIRITIQMYRKNMYIGIIHKMDIQCSASKIR